MKAIISHIMAAVLALSVLSGCGARGQMTTGNAEARVTARPSATAVPNNGGVTGAVNDAGNAVGGAVGGVGNAVGDVVNGAGNAVGSVVNGVGNAIGDMADGVENAVTGNNGAAVSGTTGNERTATPTPNR